MSFIYKLNRAACRLATLFIRGYQILISPILHSLLGAGSGCRHTPSCSRYAMECYAKHSFWKATGYTLRRISRCHPWGTEGNDPVPD